MARKSVNNLVKETVYNSLHLPALVDLQNISRISSSDGRCLSGGDHQQLYHDGAPEQHRLRRGGEEPEQVRLESFLQGLEVPNYGQS